MNYRSVKKNTLLVLSKKIKKRLKNRSLNLLLGGIGYSNNISCNLIRYFMKNQKIFLDRKLLFNIFNEEKRTLTSFQI